MQTTLAAFERVDGLYGSLARMGKFETCADPRGFINASNKLLDACITAGMDYDTNSGFDTHEEWAASYIIAGLSSASIVEDAS